MTLDIKDRLYTSSEVAEILGVSLRSVYRYLEEGKLDADIKTATGRHRFSKKNILDFLQPSESHIKNSSHTKSEVSNISVEDAGPVNQVTSFSPTETITDNFDFDNFFETDVVKKAGSTEFPTSSTPTIESNSSSLLDEDEDLEKLFEELEKEFSMQNNPTSTSNDTQKQVSKLSDDDFEFDFDFLEGKESVSEYLKVEEEPVSKSSTSNDSKENFDFDFLNDFFSEDKKDESKESVNETVIEADSGKKLKSTDEDDFDFFDLDSIFEDLNSSKQDKKFEGREEEEVQDTKEETFSDDTKDDSEGWLERFRKASEKVTETKPKKIEDNFDISSFLGSNSTTSSISSKTSSATKLEEVEEEFKSSRVNKKKEYYYMSSLSGPKEIAQTIDKISRKFDLDYAFTLNAGLSLHKDISPFTLIHVYINERDLEIFEDYLKLTPSSERDAHLCIKVAEDRDIFDDSYELNGLFVVSNVQLRSDFIDKGMDNYAREV